MKTKISILTFTFLLLFGCSSPTSQKTCTYYQSEYAITSVNTIEYSKDTVSSITLKSTIDLEKTPMEKEVFIASLDSRKATVETLKGVDLSYTANEKTIVSTTKIDLSEADVNELLAENLLSKDEVNKDGDVSYKQTLKFFKKIGYSCK